MDIHPIIETRRAKRRNGAAYQHRRRRSLTGGHSIITHARRMEYQRSHSMFLTHGLAGTARSSWSDRASLPRKRPLPAPERAVNFPKLSKISFVVAEADQ